MKANELMVGDYVAVNKDVFFMRGTLVEILGIDTEKEFPEKGLEGCALCLSVDYPGELKSKVWIDYLYPIPLTDDILKNNGFEYHHKNIASLSYDHPFKLEMVNWPDENGIGLWMIAGIIRIQYVHELQNALKLAGIEKKITLK